MKRRSNSPHRRPGCPYPLLFSPCTCFLSLSAPRPTCARWLRHHHFVVARHAGQQLPEGARWHPQ